MIDNSRLKKIEPSFGVLLLFFLLFSGPPKFRIRDAEASLEGLIDWSIILNIVAWIAGGIWVWSNRRAWPIVREWSRAPIEEMLTLLLCGLLALSVAFSPAPAFSGFKAYQLITTYAFVRIFSIKYGIPRLLKTIFWCCAILSVADIVAAVVTPGLVLFQGELGELRFRGDLIAQTGVVSLIGLVLLLTVQSDLPRKKWNSWFLVLGGVLVFSLMRTSYLAMAAVLLLAVIRRPAIPILRRISTFLVFSAPLFIGFLLSELDKYRKVEDIWTLSNRLGLWAYLVNATLAQGPWFGLGYFAASRVYAPEFNPDLGTAHSAFIEIYVGGGLVSLVVFTAIWLIVGWRVAKLLFQQSDKYSFAAVALFTAVLCLNLVGGELQAEPSGFCLWCLVAILPVMVRAYRERMERAAVPGIAPRLGPATSG